MSLQHWKTRTIEPKPTAGKHLIAAAKEMRATARGKPGPKPSGTAKQLISLRIDQNVIAKFRATGPGWQARMNDVLKAAKV